MNIEQDIYTQVKQMDERVVASRIGKTIIQTFTNGEVRRVQNYDPNKMQQGEVITSAYAERSTQNEAEVAVFERSDDPYNCFIAAQ